jgi:hypothetical protein
MFRAAIGLSFLCILATSVGVNAQVPESVAIVLPARVVIEPGRYQGMTEISVVNQSAATITAWSVSHTCEGDDQTSWGFGIDDWPRFERVGLGLSAPGGGFIAPGSVGVHRNTACGLNSAPATLTLRWVIFEDSTWMGDVEGVEAVFAKRSMLHDSWVATLAVLDEVSATASGRDALIAARARLMPLSSQTMPNGATDTLSNIELALDERRTGKPLPDYWLAELLAEARFQVTAGERHARPATSHPLPAQSVRR